MAGDHEDPQLPEPGINAVSPAREHSQPTTPLLLPPKSSSPSHDLVSSGSGPNTDLHARCPTCNRSGAITHPIDFHRRPDRASVADFVANLNAAWESSKPKSSLEHRKMVAWLIFWKKGREESFFDELENLQGRLEENFDCTMHIHELLGDTPKDNDEAEASLYKFLDIESIENELGADGLAIIYYNGHGEINEMSGETNSDGKQS